MSNSDFDPDRLRIDAATVNGWMENAHNKGRGPRKPARRGKFLAGPVPLSWLKRAAALPGKALAVGLAVWFLKNYRKRKTVRLTRRTLERFDVGRKPGYRGLLALEVAGLVRVQRRRGCSPWVTVCQPRGGPVG